MVARGDPQLDADLIPHSLSPALREFELDPFG